jgi:hypothetical protein
MKQRGIIAALLILIILQGIIDYLFVFLYPTVNPIRATMIGLSALLVLYLARNITRIKPVLGFLSIYASALIGALLVQAVVLVSKSVLSGIAHILILIIVYLSLRTPLGGSK